MMIYLNVTHLFNRLTFTEFLLSAWWLSDKDSACRCRRYGFNPWVGKILWRRKWNPLQCSCLRNPMDRGTWQASPWGHKKLDTTRQQLYPGNVLDAGDTSGTETKYMSS